MSTRLNHDKLTYSGTDITLYDTEVRRTMKNEYISFVEPIQSAPDSSIYNLQKIKTEFLIKSWISDSDMDPDGYSSGTIDYFMLQSSPVTLQWRDNTVNGYIKKYTVLEKPSEQASGYVQIELLFEKATQL